MIAVNPSLSELSPTEQETIDQIWLQEEQLVTPTARQSDLAEIIASDFVSFDDQGNAIAKQGYVNQLSEGSAKGTAISRLWAHFGSENSCCLAYLQETENAKPDICMALWIERDGAWQKTFHHQNAKFG